MQRVRTSPSDGFIEPLTSLRAFAAIYVVVFHYGNSFIVGHAGTPAVVGTFLGNGRLGVAFFFVLSGFILARVYDGRLQTAGQLGRYAIARIARVYPVYLLALLWVLLLGGPYVSPAGWRWFPQFLCLQSWVTFGVATPDNWNTPAWTLSVEALFYVLFPIIINAFRNSGMLTLLIILAGIAAVIASTGWAAIGYERHALNGSAAYLPLSLLRLPEFAYGVVLGRISMIYVPNRRENNILFPLLIAVILCSLTARTEVAAPMLVLTSGALVWALAVWPATRIGRLLSHRSLVLLGGASYSVYILQTPVHETLRAAFGDNMLVRISFYPILVAIAVMVFMLIEEPARGFIRKVAVVRKSAVNQRPKHT